MAGERILLIEDDPIIREFTLEVLEALGFVVVDIDNAEEGLASFAKEQPALVFVGEALPGAGGLDACIRLLTVAPTQALILVSAGPLDSPMLDEARHGYGIENILIWPFDSHRLATEVFAALRIAPPVGTLEPVQPVDEFGFDPVEPADEFGFDPAEPAEEFGAAAFEPEPVQPAAAFEPEPEEPPRPPRRPFGTGAPVLTEHFVADMHVFRREEATVEALDDEGEPAEQAGAEPSGFLDLPGVPLDDVPDLPDAELPDLDAVDLSSFQDIEAPSGSGLSAAGEPAIEAVGAPDESDPDSAIPGPSRDDEVAFSLRPMVPASPSDPQGIYGEVLLGDLLYNAFRDIFTGRLVLQRGNVTKWITLRNGFPIDATSNVRSEDLAWRLAFDGVLSDAAHARYRQLVTNQGLDPRQALLDLGVIGPAELFEVQRRLVRERILGCFDWSGASYGLSYDPHAADLVTAFEVNPLVLIFEGIKRSFPIAPLVTHFNAHGGLPVRRTEKLRDYGRLLKDFPEEMHLAEGCDGVITVGGLIARSSFGLIDTLRILRALEIMKCLAFDRGEVAPVARPSQSMNAVRDRGSVPGPQSAAPASVPPPAPRPMRPSMPLPSSPIRPSAASPARTTGGQPAVPRTTGAPEPLGPHTTGSHAVLRPSVTGSFSVETGARRTDSGVHRPVTEEAARAAIQEKFASLGQANHYELIDATADASLETLRNALARVARNCHPDALGPTAGDELRRRAAEVQRRLAQAWEVLSDPKRRQDYDLLHVGPLLDAGGKPDIVKAEANFQKGKMCLAKGESRRSLEFFEAAVKQDNHVAVYRIYRGWNRYLCSDAVDLRTRHDAREEIKSALAADESQDAGYLFLGLITKATGNDDLAERFFRKTLALNPANAEASRELRLLDTRRREKPKEGLFNRILGPKK